MFFISGNGTLILSVPKALELLYSFFSYPTDDLSTNCQLNLQNASGIQPLLNMFTNKLQVHAIITSHLDYCSSLTGLHAFMFVPLLCFYHPAARVNLLKWRSEYSLHCSKLCNSSHLENSNKQTNSGSRLHL